MKPLFFLIGLSCSCFASLFSQSVAGHVMDESGQPLPGASVRWSVESGGAITDKEGYFELPAPKTEDNKLIAGMEGYQSDTLPAHKGDHIDFNLAQEVNLEDVVIQDKSGGTYISSIETSHTEVITSRELGKAACCDLAGAFETQATVQAVTTNVLTNSKELRVLGLSGYYNQVLIEGFPLIQGLTYTYGIASIPGTIIDKIYVAKGANSVLQGYDGLTGQLNVLFRHPAKTEPLLLNVYANSFGETQYNTQFASPLGTKKAWSTLVAAHAAIPGGKFDRDGDSFLDVTLINRHSLFNMWRYRAEDSLGLSVKAGGIYLEETRTGGQKTFDPQTDLGSDSLYGQVVHYRQPAAFSKITYMFNDKMRLAVFASGSRHDQDSWFGTTRYKAQQTLLFGNSQMEMKWLRYQLLKTGLSYRFTDLSEDIRFSRPDTLRSYDGNYLKEERIPGIFAENTFHFFINKLTLITGIRADYHNTFGWLFTPRAVAKWEMNGDRTLRIAGGTGYRTANIFSENINLLASMRNVVFTEMLNPEHAVNWGGSITQKLKFGSGEGAVTLDWYSTRFLNQIFPDYNSTPGSAIIENFAGPCVSNGFQAEANAELWNVFSFKVAYNFLDVHRTVSGSKSPLPFNSRHRLMGSFSLKPVKSRWHLDINTHWFGTQFLASTVTNPEVYRFPEKSEPYILLNGQFTWSWPALDIYAGCENIMDFRQKRPIVAWQEPFSPYFDTANVWGPTRGREFHVGIRYKIPME